MSLPRLVDPEKVIAYLNRYGWRESRRTPNAAVLLHEEFDNPIIVPVHGLLRPTEIADILWNANIDLTDFDELIRP